jgi:SAM-dependent methyltransferase
MDLVFQLLMAPQKCNAVGESGDDIAMPNDNDQVLRGLNSLIANGYDRVPYDPPASPGLDPEQVFALAANYGYGRDHRGIDILDLACGTGAQLERAAGLTTGKLVGTDLSRAAYDKAVARTARFGSRLRMMCADFMDLNADQLGRFDLIYHVGVLYVTPPTVQSRLLELIADCLKPGGVAVISYYAGTVPLLMAGLHKVLRASADPNEGASDQIRAAKAQVQTMLATMAKVGGERLMSAVLQQVYATEDTIFYHEMLNQSFAALSTSALETALGARGVHFLNWMQPAPFEKDAPPRMRALMADAYAFARGGYFYGVFCKTG